VQLVPFDVLPVARLVHFSTSIANAFAMPSKLPAS